MVRPTDFFINVTDFFSVLLPGALVVYFIKGLTFSKMFGSEGVFPAPETALQAWLLFLLATYIIGHITFLLGSLLLDKLVYNKFLRITFFKRNHDLAYHSATLIRQRFIPTDEVLNQIRVTKKIVKDQYQIIKENPNRELLNTYKWVLSYFALHRPEVLAEVKKMEADSKFFRSLVIALLFIGVVLVLQGSGYAVLFFVLMLLSIYRYGDLRYKSTQRAYELILTKFHDKKLKKRAVVPTSHNNVERFQPSNEKTILYKDKISKITAGLSRKSTLLSIEEHNTWASDSRPNPSEFYCIEGKGTIKLLEKNGSDISFLSPGAIINVPPKTAFEISSQKGEPLLLVAVA
ncbi:hypothetical protein ZONE111905_00230 [Zobellia nedashkovskayae]